MSSRFQYEDEHWAEEKWKSLLEHLISSELLTWKEIAALTLGHLNPSQVGTSLASSEGFKLRYGKGNTMRVVMNWFYNQNGRCVDCGTRLELQADHNTSRESFDNPLDADFIENLVLRCRRCNVIKRPSHQFGGNTYLTAEAALMWILFNYRPRTLRDFIRMCRLYGMTMSDIRMQEGWAMAHWLQSEADFHYEIDAPDKPCLLFYWPNGAITRAWPKDGIEGVILYESILPASELCFVTAERLALDRYRVMAYRVMVKIFPFSHYFVKIGEPPYALAINYSAPKRGGEIVGRPIIGLMPPSGMDLLAHTIIQPEQSINIQISEGRRNKVFNFSTAQRQKLLGYASRIEDLKIALFLE